MFDSVDAFVNVLRAEKAISDETLVYVARASQATVGAHVFLDGPFHITDIEVHAFNWQHGVNWRGGHYTQRSIRASGLEVANEENFAGYVLTDPLQPLDIYHISV